VQEDGGDLEFVGVDDQGVVSVRLHGACVGCPSSAMTLKHGIERHLRERVPEVREVICV
jgi:Fe-S cluster biogenesis protein NfuA